MKQPAGRGLLWVGALCGVLLLRGLAADSTAERPTVQLSWLASEVVKLKRAGVSTEIQKAFVENSPHSTAPTSEELLELNRLKIDDSVLLSLLATTAKPAPAPALAAPGTPVDLSSAVTSVAAPAAAPAAAPVTIVSQPAPQVVYSPAPVYYAPSVYSYSYYDTYPYWGYSSYWPTYGYYRYPLFRASIGWHGGGGYHGGGGGHFGGHVGGGGGGGGRPPVGHPGGGAGGGGSGGGHGGHRGR